MGLKQIAEQAWAEDVVVVETYRVTGAVALHGGLVGVVHVRE